MESGGAGVRRSVSWRDRLRLAWTRATRKAGEVSDHHATLRWVAHHVRHIAFGAVVVYGLVLLVAAAFGAPVRP